MSKDSAAINLTHHFLIAMPNLADDVFARSVVYLCDHSERGAMGLMVNKPAGIHLSDLFAKVELPLDRPELASQPVFQGGPVQTERGFVLHEPMGADDQHAYASTLTVEGADLEMTTSRDVLEALSAGAGPKRLLVTLGYSSWAQGQLESELAENSWLTVPASPDIIFDVPVAQRYDAALALLGLQAWMISPEAGHS
jgi:putative transcriptional regulator